MVAHMKRFSWEQKLQAKTECGNCIWSHVVYLKFILLSHVSVTLDWTRMSHPQLSLVNTPGGLYVTWKMCSNNRNLFCFKSKPDWIREKYSVLIRKNMMIKGNQKNYELSTKLGCEITHGCATKRRQCSATSVGNLRRQTPLHWHKDVYVYKF